MKVIKSLFRIAVVALILGAIGLGVLHIMSKQTPNGYNPSQLTDAQREEYSKNVVLNKLPKLFNLANQASANASSASRAKTNGTPVPAAATQPIEPVTVTFTQDELNSTIFKHTESIKGSYQQYVIDPYFVLDVIDDKGTIVLMGTVPEFGRVASAYFQPGIDKQGMLRFELSSIRLGSLPLPEAVLAKKRLAVEASLKAALPDWQQGAKIDESKGGQVNEKARAAALAKFVLQVFAHEPSPAVMFLPQNIEDWAHTFPLRLTDVTVAKGSLTITAKPMTADERAELLKTIREPVQSASVDVPKS